MHTLYGAVGRWPMARFVLCIRSVAGFRTASVADVSPLLGVCDMVRLCSVVLSVSALLPGSL